MTLVRRLQHDHNADVTSLMNDSFDARSGWIRHHSPPVRSVMAMFPPLKDILSSHVSYSFLRRVSEGYKSFLMAAQGWY